MHTHDEYISNNKSVHTTPGESIEHNVVSVFVTFIQFNRRMLAQSSNNRKHKMCSAHAVAKLVHTSPTHCHARSLRCILCKQVQSEDNAYKGTCLRKHCGQKQRHKSHQPSLNKVVYSTVNIGGEGRVYGGEGKRSWWGGVGAWWGVVGAWWGGVGAWWGGEGAWLGRGGGMVREGPWREGCIVGRSRGGRYVVGREGSRRGSTENLLCA